MKGHGGHYMALQAMREAPQAVSLGLVCPICESDTVRVFVKDGYWIRACVNCRHRCAEIPLAVDHVARVYDDAYFHGGGAGYPDYLCEAALLRDCGRRYGRLLRRYMKPGRMLDVGAAAGFVMEGFMDCGWRGGAIEPNAHMAALLRERLGVDVYVGPLDEFSHPEPFDLVVMIQVIGHFLDVSRSLRAAARATRPGGFWLIETWNRESAAARLFGRRWHEYSPPSVLNWFAPDGLARLAGHFGFVERARGRPRKRLNGAHAKSLLRYKLRGTPGAAVADVALGLIPDHLTIPYLSADLFWTLFQHREPSPGRTVDR